MNLYVLSDLHVWGTKDPLYQSMISLIREKVSQGDILVFAGDVFDLFVGGKKIFIDRYDEFISELKRACTRGAEVHYLEGNHDFQLETAFPHLGRLNVHSGDLSLILDGKKFWISHGDLVNVSDYRYKTLRAFFRSRAMKNFVDLMPGTVIEWIGTTSSRYSRGKKPLLFSDLPEKKRDELRQIYRNYAHDRFREGYDFVVLGHCHDLDEWNSSAEGRQVQYVNMGFPRVHGTYLSWSTGQDKFKRAVLPSPANESAP